EKAAEHLRAIIDRAPKHLAAHEKLYRILLDEGDIEGARTAAMQYVGLLEEKNDPEAIDVVRNEFSSRGHSLATAAAPPKRPKTVKSPAPAPPPPEAAAADEEFSLELESRAMELPLPEEVAEQEISFDEPAPVPVEGLTFVPAPEPELSLGEEPPRE